MPDLSGAGWMAVCVILTVAVATMSVSAYCNDTRAADDPLYGVMASGERTEHGAVACGPSYPFGTLVAVPGWGWGVCMDRGGAITDGHLDLWMDSEEAALRWGRQELEVSVLEVIP
jgi:3D (Asp-Asp-Asp) domain-containing protein